MIRKNTGKRLTAVFLTLCIAAGMAYSPYAVQGATQTDKEAGYMVKVVSDRALEDIKSEYEEEKTVSTLSDNNLEEKKIATVNIDSKEAQMIKQDNSTLYVEPDIIVTGSGTTEKQIENEAAEWNIQAIHADDTDVKNTGDKVKVALIDSGVDLFNDIEVKESINLIPGEEEVLPLFWDTSGHGTSIAGIMAAQDNDEGITGIAPDIELYSARVLDADKKAPLSRVIEAIYWAIDKKVNIINLSFGTTVYSEIFEKAIQDAVNAGILVIAAAGNNGTVEYPAAFEGVMAVGGTDTNGDVSSFSATGKEIEVVAPAEKICSTGGFDGTIICSGTSMAAPHVAGIAARLWSRDLSVSADFIRLLIDASANSNCGTENECGYGLVDLERAESIYNDFKENYNSKESIENNRGTIEPNDEKIESYDVDYVNGSWSLDVHQRVILGDQYTSSQIDILKKGAIYPDISSKISGMKAHPVWHGWAKTNYISAYVFITKMAYALKNGTNILKVSGVKDLGNTRENNMRNVVNQLSWSSSDILSGHKLTKGNKSLFVLGMAIHHSTDIFAHSTRGRINGVWEHLDHTKKYNPNPRNGMADDTSKFPYRYVTAKQVAKNILERYTTDKIGSTNEFVKGCSYKEAGTSWCVINLKENIAIFDSENAKKLKDYSAPWKESDDA